MKFGSTTRRVFVAVMAGSLAFGALAGQASAADVPQSNGAADRAQLDREIDSVLASTAGGKRVGANQIVWEDRGATMTFPMPGETRARAAGEAGFKDCPTGRVCLFKDSRWRGVRLSFYKCNFEKLRWYDFTNVTSSWVNVQTGNAYSQLDYWDGSKVRALHGMTPVRAFSFGTSWMNDKADFLRVC